MKKTLPLLAVCGLLTMAACQSNDKTATTAAPDANAEAAVRQRVDQLSATYLRKDLKGFMALVDLDRSLLLGTDSAEVNVGQAAIEQQMKDDFGTVDSLRFGTLANYHSETSPTIATAFFDAPITAYNQGRAYHGMVRFATVWRKRDDGQWYMSQGLVSRPTKGQSSRDMVAKRTKKAGQK